jgi:hypothetical protein
MVGLDGEEQPEDQFTLMTLVNPAMKRVAKTHERS